MQFSKRQHPLLRTPKLTVYPLGRVTTYGAGDYKEGEEVFISTTPNEGFFLSKLESC